MILENIKNNVWGATYDHSYWGIHFNTRMTIVACQSERGTELAIISAIPISSEMQAEIEALGVVRYIVIPSLMHDSYVLQALERFPTAELLAPKEWLSKGRSGTPLLNENLEPHWQNELQISEIGGAPLFAERVIYTRSSQTLVATDLFLNIREANNWWSRLLFKVEGVWGRFSMSPLWKLAVRDQSSFHTSMEQVLSLPFETLVVAHGPALNEEARSQATKAYLGRFGQRATPQLSA